MVIWICAFDLLTLSKNSVKNSVTGCQGSSNSWIFIFAIPQEFFSSKGTLLSMLEQSYKSSERVLSFINEGFKETNIEMAW